MHLGKGKKNLVPACNTAQTHCRMELEVFLAELEFRIPKIFAFQISSNPECTLSYTGAWTQVLGAMASFAVLLSVLSVALHALSGVVEHVIGMQRKLLDTACCRNC